ncbi:MAG: hypothetical protein HPY90_14090 [Syntrophothermus sp.]|uniref:AAA family ATPase n=1 Tax=Syntrophothermus sp. TaxID=2736299 RepID=UPI00257A88A5|nr:hypothetical protein [Syntrophothermus sp.]NSW84368.1 hypothetical protein [Syntrophothermus sp.]
MISIAVGGPPGFIERVRSEIARCPELTAVLSASDPGSLVDSLERHVGACDAVLLGFAEDQNRAVLEVIMRHGKTYVPFVSAPAGEYRKWAALRAYPTERGREVEAVCKFFNLQGETGINYLVEKVEKTKGPAPVAAKIAAFVSCRGGAGTSFIAAHLAETAAEECDTVLIDTDTRCLLSQPGQYLGAKTCKMSLASWIDFPCANRNREGIAHRYLNRTESKAWFLPAVTEVWEIGSLTAELMANALGVLQRHFALTVVDCGSYLSDISLSALELADEVFLVTTPEKNDLELLEAFLTGVFPFGKVPQSKLSIILNKLPPGLERTAGRIAAGFGLPLAAAAPPADSREDFGREITKLKRRLLQQPAGKPQGLIDRLKNFFGGKAGESK